MKAHLSINVGDVARSVEFYSKIFAQAPQKQAPRYAKFDLREPSLNFSMQQVSEGRAPSQVNHLGVEVESAEAVREWKQRVDALGIPTLLEEDTECCYARQDKFWFEDPDGNRIDVGQRI